MVLCEIEFERNDNAPGKYRYGNRGDSAMGGSLEKVREVGVEGQYDE